MSGVVSTALEAANEDDVSNKRSPRTSRGGVGRTAIYSVNDGKDSRVMLDLSSGVGQAPFGYTGDVITKAALLGAKLRAARGETVYSGEAESDEVKQAVVALVGEAFGKAGGTGFLVPTGASSVEGALALSKQAFFLRNPELESKTESVTYLSFNPSYHGATAGSDTASAGPKAIAADVLGNDRLKFLRTPGYLRGGKDESESEVQYVERMLKEAREAFEDCKKQNKPVASILIETVSGGSGAAVKLPKGYLKGLKALCEEYGASLILDEVMCGMGRTGHMFAYQHPEIEGEGFAPDFVATSKALNGGQEQVGAILYNYDTAKLLKGQTLKFSHTMANYAPSGAITNLMLDEIKKTLKAKEGEPSLKDIIAKRLAANPEISKHIADVRGFAYMFGIEFVDSKESMLPIHPTAEDKSSAKYSFVQDLREIAVNEEQLWFYPVNAGYRTDGTGELQNSDSVLFMPPYNMTLEEKHRAAIRFERVVLKALAKAEGKDFTNPSVSVDPLSVDRVLKTLNSGLKSLSVDGKQFEKKADGGFVLVMTEEPGAYHDIDKRYDFRDLEAYLVRKVGGFVRHDDDDDGIVRFEIPASLISETDTVSRMEEVKESVRRSQNTAIDSLGSTAKLLAALSVRAQSAISTGIAEMERIVVSALRKLTGAESGVDRSAA